MLWTLYDCLLGQLRLTDLKIANSSTLEFQQTWIVYKIGHGSCKIFDRVIGG